VNALVKDETIWLTQKAMAELFGVQTPAISKHLKNIFAEGELQEKVVVSKMGIPTPHGAIAGKTQQHETTFYNLDAIISVGYRVNSRRATMIMNLQSPNCTCSSMACCFPGPCRTNSGKT